MSFPYVIWTLRRTGGTTLTGFLNSLSEHPVVQHEPFNEERVFGHVSTGWRRDPDPDRVFADITDCLTRRPLIKHCFELVAPEVNTALLEITTRLGYRHIMLDRASEVDRILSLELAKITGVWGKVGSFSTYEQVESGALTLDPIDIPGAVAHLRFCARRRGELRAELARLEAPHVDVLFEDVYSDFDTGRRKVRQVLRFLEIDPKQHRGFGPKLHHALQRQGQNSARVIDLVPNVEAARTALTAAWDEVKSPPR